MRARAAKPGGKPWEFRFDRPRARWRRWFARGSAGGPLVGHDPTAAADPSEPLVVTYRGGSVWEWPIPAEDLQGDRLVVFLDTSDATRGCLDG